MRNGIIAMWMIMMIRKNDGGEIGNDNGISIHIKEYYTCLCLLAVYSYYNVFIIIIRP